MIRNLEAETMTFGDDAEFHRNLNAFIRLCLERIRMFPWTILRFFYNCWYFFIYLARSIIKLLLRRYIAIFVLISSVIISACVIVFRKDQLLVTLIYCFSLFLCSTMSLFLRKGSIRFVIKSRSELLENQKLLAESYRRNEQETAQPAGYGAQDKRPPLLRVLEDLKEPRPGTSGDPTIEDHRSSSYESFKCCDESSAGPSHAPDCSHCFKITTISEDSYYSDEPSERPSVARISVDAVKAFGPPLQVFGADSYKIVFDSSDEERFLNESLDSKANQFEVPVEVHHSDSHSPSNSHNDGSRSSETASVAKDESEVKVGSGSLSNLFHIDDQSSEPSCSNTQTIGSEKST